MGINIRRIRPGYFVLIGLILLASCGIKDTKWKGQAPLERVETATRPIQYQLKKTYAVGDGIYLSNEFAGARLNGVALTGKNEVSVLITPENTPINESPWYAFKIWSDTPQEIQLKLTYTAGYSHRYYPKISNNGKTWTRIDSSSCHPDPAALSGKESPKYCTLDLSLTSDTLWIAAQELIVSTDIYKWAEQLSESSFVVTSDLAKSREGRPIKIMQIGNPESKKLLMILSRQHPPEVTGWLAMKAFVERLCVPEDSLASLFRNEYCIYVVPCMNPDGVDNGHWRNSSAGIDLNRDWEAFNQPETQAVRKFMQEKILQKHTFYFAVDFHSTFEDIFYTISPKLKGNMPGLVPKIIKTMAKDIPGYHPNIRPNEKDALRINSTVSIFHSFHAEAMTYEVGDDTPRELIKKKGELTAESMMELMLSGTTTQNH
ncbi:M14 family metallopeptidase [Maribellus sediminis]|uniref:M14 family metallopeptidase n=1 Tax=Maribellus sediminis TaxID=2696285 RepID=UPI00142FE9BC|nr:M14 family metallopeptidase [Maribellus sediminis]